ncbi:MAG: gliding motility-associated C-terminal domain-containing protein [Saprospiraceae bacterium]
MNLDLTVLQIDTTTITATICQGDSYILGSDTFSLPGMHTAVLQNFFGCDSVVMLDLSVLLPTTTMLTDTICNGDSVVIGNTAYTLPGMYTDTLSSFFNCDSIVTLDLTVVYVSVNIAPPDTLTCAQNSVTLNTAAATSMGMISYQWMSGPGGNFTGAVNAPMAEVDAPATYIVTVEATGCSAADTVEVIENAVPPIAVSQALSPDTLTCAVLSVQLDGTASTGNGPISYAWSGQNGSPLSNPNVPTPTVTMPDVYDLVVTDLVNGCSDTAGVTVYQNILPPSANAGADTMLSCAVLSLTLDGTASSAAGGLSYAWSTTGGNILPPANIATPTVDQDGVYQLIVTDLVNACQDTGAVVVAVDTLAPQANIGFPNGGTLTCATAEVTLQGSNASGSQSLTYGWTGNISGGQGTPTATTTTPGTFSLILTDTLNGCTDTATVIVGLDTIPPVVDAGPGGALSCTAETVTIGTMTTSSGPNFSYQWTSSPGGSMTSNTDSTYVTVDSAGTYTLTVTNLQNGCTAADSTIVVNNANPPVANAGPDGILDCDDVTFILDGSGSTIVPFTNILWQNSNGATIATTEQVTVDYPDTFTLTVSFAFCEDTDTVVVTAIAIPPLADAGADMTLDCLTGQATLDGTGSDSGPDFAVQWSGGSIASGDTTLTPVVDATGTYVLSVTNMANDCVSTDTAVVTLDTAACMPVVSAGAGGLVNCYALQDTLEASGPNGAVFNYQWIALTGSILDDTDPFAPIVSGGQFVLSVTNTAVNLTATDTVTVVADTVAPVADAGPQILTLNCPQLDSCYALDVANSSQGPQYTYFWESLDGEFCTPADELFAQILGNGIYNLQVTDVTNGCMADDAVLVQLFDFQPVANAGPNIQMACADTLALPDGSASSTGPTYLYQWTSASGNILNNGNTLSPQVTPNNNQDTFLLEVLNTVNLCRDTDEMVVFGPTGCLPGCNATVSGILTCDVDTVTLSGLGSTQSAITTYQWTALSGNLCGSTDSIITCADAPGIYQLAVTNNFSGVEFTATCQVQVLENVQVPFADAGQSQNITCTNPARTLNGTLSSAGANIIYEWLATPGNFVSGATTLAPVVDEPGFYTLIVTDTLNGCTSSDFVNIGLDTLHPLANAGPGDILTCTNSNTVLSGSATPASGVSFAWSTSNGDLCAGSTSPNPVVCAAGTYYLTVTITANGCTGTDSTVVTSSADFPVVNTGPDLYYTCADTVFTILATATGGSVLTYDWTSPNGGCFLSPATVLQPTVNCPGTYELMVTDVVNGCTATSVVEVLLDTLPPVAGAGNTQEINCQNPTVTLDGSGSTPAGALDFLWVASGNGNIVSGATTPAPVVDSAGVYTLIVTGQGNQCKDTASVTITLDTNIPVADAGPDTTLTCTRTSLGLDGSGTSASPTIFYTWVALPGNIVNGGGTLSPEIDLPGTYVLTVEDTASLCVVTDTVQVAMDTLSPMALIDPAPLTVTCGNPQVIIMGGLSTPADSLNFQWTTNDGHIFTGVNAANVTVDSGGMYTLTVTHTRNGCTATASIPVDEDFEKPFVQLAPAPVLNCYFPAAQLEVFPPTTDTIYTYLWTGPPPILDGNTLMPTVSAPGFYKVTVTNTLNGCEEEGSLIVTEDFNAPDAEASAPGTLDCDNLSVSISGEGSSTGNVSYLWTTNSGGNIGDTTALVTQTDAPGWYYLTVQFLDNGCTATDSAEVLATAIPITGAEITTESPNCKNPDGFIFIDSVIGGDPPFFYSLDGGIFITYPQFSYLGPGSYQLAIEDLNGCNWETILTLDFPGEILVELGEDQHIRLGESVNLEALLSFPADQLDTVIWQNLPDSVECPTCLAQVVAPEETTVYRVRVIDENGCMAEDKVTVWVDEKAPYFVPNAFSPNGDGNNDRLVFFAGEEVAVVHTFRIFDRWGDLVFSAENFQPNDPAFGWDGTFGGKPMNTAVFVWMAEVEYLDGQREVVYGDATLLR